MIEIDGSYGEGGGQILRTSIGLSALIRKPIKVYNIRLNRPKPGLAQQHLTGIKAIQRMTDAEVKGLRIGSTEVEFLPRALKPGSYKIEIGTAGSISLVLQALLIPSAFSEGVTEMKITGGTDVKWSPPIDFIKNVLFPVLNKMGYKAEIEVIKRGYYPRGGGEVHVKIFHVENFSPIELVERGDFVKIFGVAHSLNLPCPIVEREVRAAMEVLEEHECEIEIECKKDFSTGTGITLWAVYENSILGASALGEIGKPAEKVGEEAAIKLLTETERGAVLDRYLSDQIVPYMALADGRSKVAVGELTNHLKTNIYLVEKILGNEFKIEKEGKRYHISTKGIGFKNEFL